MRKSYSHLNRLTYYKNQYEENQFYRSTSRYIWRNQLQTTFMMYLQAIIMAGARRIKYLVHYQNPINTTL